MTESGIPRLLLFDLAARRAAVGSGGGLSALADALSRELEPLVSSGEQGALPMPAQKARLTRVGGRCPVHGVYLDFDPWSPHAHRCARCDREYQGPDHDAWWAMGAQLWIAERAVHAAALYLLRGDERHAALASRILAELAERYESWPNSDNVLGPSRPFFSTYLESIWLLNICHALDLLECGDAPGVDQLGRRVRRQLLRPSATLIASFPEGRSNRQVWNEVAVLSALTLLGDEEAVASRLDDPDGLASHFERGLLPDGSWFEGENYHLFAHRGLWYGVQLLATREETLPEGLDRRFRDGFVTPFLGLLPDDTLPSRNDSQYRVSMHQWRIAEHLELGYAHAPDERIAGLLARCYDDDVRVADDTARARSTADAERNGPASRLTRHSLSWRALLAASIEAPPAGAWQPASVHLPAQGLAVIRRERARVYVALEGGETGGGHGHPDQLALTLQCGDERWLEDPGTGSYVEPALHWYRSTLAHAAPLFDGASQQPVRARTLAFEDRGGAGWIVKSADGIADGVRIRRSVVVCDGYLLDVVEWNGDIARTLTLTLCNAASLVEMDDSLHAESAAWAPVTLASARSREDGFDFLQAPQSCVVPQRAAIVLDAIPRAAESRCTARLWYAVSGADTVSLVRGMAPDVPGTGGTAARHLLQATAQAGRVVGVWSWPDAQGNRAVTSVSLDPASDVVAVVETGGTRALHSQSAEGWHIELLAGDARSSIDLARGTPAAPDQSLDAPVVGVHASDGDTSDGDTSGVDTNDGDTNHDDAGDYPLTADFDVPFTTEDLALRDAGEFIEDALLIPLGSANYLQTEVSWEDAGEPTAMVQLVRTATHLVVDVAVASGPVVAQQPDADGGLYNPLDNEDADVNSDGLQWYIGVPEAARWSDAALVAAADAASAREGSGAEPRSHPLVPGGNCPAEAAWTVTDEGWAMRLAWALADLPVDADGCIAFDLVVNERPAERERRRGQLVLSGGGGFAYLRGDRHEPASALVLAVT